MCRKGIITFVPIFFIISFLLIGGASAEEGERSTCSHCGAEILAENLKFSVNQPGAKPVSFADIHHALLWRDGQCTALQYAFDGSALVYDYNTEEAIAIADAWYVKSTEISTPAGSGIIAFKDKALAEKFVSDKNSKILSYDDLLLLPLN
ncbi:MAG: nitrous oxide reductase accessory protein NosL [Nitrospirota bacterium]|nr:MAG: nitrous oxide reductase accessory protein NosL [Nitrospirota bacterium]